jgi:eukaryotic-like serine/threonine-protein kinase
MTKDPNNGRLLSNRYQLVELVGEGAMGRVYRAKDTLLGDVTVAVKFLSQTLLNQKMRERFEREATVCALLGEKSIHIVRVRDYGVDDYNIPFYVMEFLQGEGLSEIIKFQPLPVKRFLTLIRQICLGLECAHKGIVFKGELCPIIHRDIKPSNILVTQDSTLGELVKVLDFGIAKLIQSSDSQTHSFMGTLAYCSPEQMEGKELDNRSDIYSLGVMMYEMLSSEMPVIPETSSFGGWYIAHHDLEPRSFDPDLKIPQALKKLVMKCLAKAPQERPQSVAEILQTLEVIQPESNKSLIAIPKPPLPDFDDNEVCYQAVWPEDKPLQKIVFPRLLRSRTGSIATLWVMLDSEDLTKRISSTRYNQFLFLTSPHPMLLWITVFHNRQYGPRWLPCYLDLKTSTGQRIARVLGESGSYRILLFAINEPQKCQSVMTCTIAAAQCQMLREWANASQVLTGSSQPQVSKKFLKQEFEKLKPKIRLKLEAVHTDYPSNISG